MLVQLKKLNIINEGYNRTSISLDKVYINPSHIISVIDYDGAREFLLREGCPVYVLDIEDSVKIVNPFPSFKEFNGKVYFWFF